MKQNAKEYLKEFANNKQNWLKALIYELIETNGKISEDKKNEIFLCLRDDTDIVINEPNISNDNPDSEIYITSLEHIRGVNALKENQKIKFHRDVTILYGLNGAGKSSYFKILNEIVGGNQKKEILPNIYLDTPQPIEVEISLQETTGQHELVKWNGDSRSIELFNKCKVFDSSYLNGLLETRQADSTLIQPLGLYLFSTLVKLIDEFKQELNNQADKKRLEKPTIELKDFRDEIKSSFENHKFSIDMEEQVRKLFVFSEDNSKKLIKTKKELSNLKQINIQDKIKLQTSDKNAIDGIKDSIKKMYQELSNYFEKVQKALEMLVKNRDANELAKKQFEILSSIPGNDNPEWKEFIKAGEKYKLKVDDSDKVCIYCRQPLRDENATRLIHAYGEFLKDESEQKLNDSIKKINTLKKEVNGISIDLTLEPNIKKILDESKDKTTQKTLFEMINSIYKILSDEKEKLLEKINKEDLKTKHSLPDIKSVLSKLKDISDEIQNEITNLSKEDTKKAEVIEKLEKLLKQLQENESIHKQKENIKKWFTLNLLEKSLRGKANKINTRSVTELSKQAHNSLLTKTLKELFKEELKFLGYSHLNVYIENAKGGKGTSSTKLSLIKNNDIKAVLSEGEQKAIALALFIAEVKIQKAKNPIILDDPVNSLDHKIAGRFAQRLLKLDNQVILFNHNRLFLDAFETSKENHVCKTIDSDCNKSKGKHIRIYQVSSEGKDAKGVLSNYKSNRAKEHVTEAKKLLQKSPFSDELKVASLLRKTVECVIDEVIFNNQLPTKYSNKNSRIAWGELKKLNNDSSIIDKLEEIHGRVSGGEMHNGTENEENPIEVDEFNNMISEIESILKIPK